MGLTIDQAFSLAIQESFRHARVVSTLYLTLLERALLLKVPPEAPHLLCTPGRRASVPDSHLLSFLEMRILRELMDKDRDDRMYVTSVQSYPGAQNVVLRGIAHVGMGADAGVVVSLAADLC